MEIVTKRIDSVFGNNFRNFENFADTSGISLGHREREVTRCANYRGIENMQIGLPLKIREEWVESDYVRIGGKQSLSLFRSIFSRIRRGCISS